MNKEIEMKQKVLEMLKEFMMGEEGSKFKPKAIEVEMISKPKESLVDEDEYESSLKDRIADKQAAADADMSEDEYEDSPEDEEADKGNKKMSLKDFLASRSE